MALSDLYQDLDPKLAGAFEQLRREFDDKLDVLRAEIGAPAPAVEEPPAATAEPIADTAPVAPAQDLAEILDPLEELKQAIVQVDRSGSQAEVLRSLLNSTMRFCSRSAVFLLRGEDVQIWGAQGFDGPQESSIGPDEQRLWARLSESVGVLALSGDQCAPICRRLGGERPVVGLLLPFVLGDQVAAAVYCDRREGDGALNVSGLQLLAFVASQVLENLPVRNRESTATLRIAESGAPDSPPQPPSDAVAAAPIVDAGPAIPDIEPEVETPAAAMPEISETEVSVEPLEPEPVIEPAAEPAELETMDPGEASIDTEEAEPAVETTGFEAVPIQPEPAEAPAPPEPEPAAWETDTTSVSPDAAPEPVASQPIAGDAPTPEPPKSDGDSGATTQVQPPEDVDGPGWAFTTTRVAPEAGEDARHEEARRLARLLVTEIKLYNEEVCEEGRKNGDVYSLLKEDIDRSRQIFEDRIDNEIRASNDYFHDALVRILAGGDADVLGV